MSDGYVWLDIETSGLDHSDDALLEVGAVVTGPDLETINGYQRVACLPMHWAPNRPETWPMDPVVRDMHTRNGLLHDCLTNVSGLDEDDLVDDFLAWTGTVSASFYGGTLTLAGSGINWFDIPWLKARMRTDAEWPFHYRTLDLSPVRTLLGMAGITTHLESSSGQTKAHRAYADAKAHLAEARLILATLNRMRSADEWLAAVIDVQDGPHANPPGGER